MSRSTNRRPSRRQQAEFTRNTARYVNKRFNVSNPFERVLVLLVIAVVVGVMVGVVLPKISPEVGELTGEYAASGPAADVLETLRVDDAQSKDGYDRDLFGYRETDDDGDGCDVRDEVLARDLEDVTFTTPGGCQVQSGVLHDLYTGKTIDFVRGPQTSSAVQIEHVVALENARSRALAIGTPPNDTSSATTCTTCWPPTARRTVRKGRRPPPTGCRPTPISAASMWPDRSGSRTNTT